MEQRPQQGPGKHTFKAAVPKGVEPGERFTATGPQGQLVDVVVPKGAAPGDLVPVEYVPSGSAPPPAVVIGVPIRQRDPELGVEEARAFASPGGDHGWSLSWAMYAAGWCVCCFLGPCGPLFWFCAWAMHWARPREERERRVRERAVAQLSCCTGVVALAVHIAVALVVVHYWRDLARVCKSMYQERHCRIYVEPGLPIGLKRLYTCYEDCEPARCYDPWVKGGAGGVYAEGSWICGAALQAGVVKEDVTGQVVVTILPGQSSYQGVKSNGVTSRSVGAHIRSFSVAPVPHNGTAPPEGNWSDPPESNSSTTTAAPA